jgi:Peptidase family M23
VTRLIVGVGAVAAVLLSPVLVVVTLVIPASSATSAAPVVCFGYAGDLPRVLATIRTVETGGNYTSTITTSSASGAYAFIDPAWRHYAALAGIDTRTYPRAKDAPPQLQDQVAADYANELLERNGGRVSSIPINWYLGHEPAPDSPEWDTLPPGNAITPRNYVDKWMRVYADLVLGADVPNDFCNGITGADATAGDPLNPLVDDTGRAWSIPVSPSAFDPSQLDDPHHDYPAWDLMIPVGTPVYALTAGTVTRVTRFAQNWWEAGCTTARPGGCQSCGMGITVDTDIGLRYTYCHNTDVFVDQGQQVTAGQQVAASGNTGYSGAPHVHIEFHLNGVQYCPQPIMQALYSGRTGPITWTTRDCSF